MSLYYAAGQNEEEEIRRLVANGADVNQAGKAGFTPMYAAAENGHEGVITLLHSFGADVKQVDRTGKTLMSIAAENGHEDVITTLHSLGADVNQVDEYGCTPIFYAATDNGRDGAINLLHSLGADVNHADKDGMTLMYIAAMEGHEGAITVLHSLGADVNQADKDGKTPMIIATENGREGVITLLNSLKSIHDKITEGDYTNTTIEDIFDSDEIYEHLSKDLLTRADNKVKVLDPTESIFSKESKEGGVLLHEVSKIGVKKEVLEYIIEMTTKNRKDKYGETPLIKTMKNKWKVHRNDQLACIFINMKDSNPEYFHPLTNKPNVSALYNYGFIPFPQFDLQKKICLLVGCIDIAGFKAVNDNFNHNEGDDFLKYYSREMQRVANMINMQYGIPDEEEKGMVVVHIYHKSGDEFFVLFQCQSEEAIDTLYNHGCKEIFGKMTKDKTTKEDKKVFTFLRLGCVWSKNLPNCNLFFEDHKQPSEELDQLEVCKDFFETSLMAKSDNLEIEVKKRIDAKYNVVRGESISQEGYEQVLESSLNVSELQYTD